MDAFLKDNQLSDQITEAASKGRSLFERLGGRTTIDRVHKIFYDKLYADPWLKQFFVNVKQSIIEAQQSDFFSHLTGGPKTYSGRMPSDAHMHIYITEELFAVRHEMLATSIAEAGVGEKERQEWLKIDAAFKNVVVKKSPSMCRKRYFTDEVLDIPAPAGRRSA